MSTRSRTWVKELRDTGHWHIAVAGTCLLIFLAEMTTPGHRWYTHEACRRILGMRQSWIAMSLFDALLATTILFMVLAARRYWRTGGSFLRLQMGVGGIIFALMLYVSFTLDPIVLVFTASAFVGLAFICWLRAGRSHAVA